MSTEQIQAQRKSLILRFMHMAAEEGGTTDVIAVAMQYGKSYHVTRHECEALLGMTLRDILNVS